MSRSKKHRISDSIEYHEAYSVLETISKYDEEKDERVVSVFKAALEMTKLLVEIKSLKDKINHQKYHIKKLEHQKKYYKALNSELNLNALFNVTDTWFRRTPPYFIRKDDE